MKGKEGEDRVYEQLYKELEKCFFGRERGGGWGGRLPIP